MVSDDCACAEAAVFCGCACACFSSGGLDFLHPAPPARASADNPNAIYLAHIEPSFLQKYLYFGNTRKMSSNPASFAVSFVVFNCFCKIFLEMLDAMRSSLRRFPPLLSGAAGIFLVVVITYWPALHGQFVWDDLLLV